MHQTLHHKAKRLAALFFVLVSTVGCDQATKSLAQSHLRDAEPRAFLDGLFWLHYAENPGAFLSFGANLPVHWQHTIFTIAVALVLVLILLLTVRETLRGHTLVALALALFLGGGLGNLIDRLTNQGRVIDFMHLDFTGLGVGSLRTGVFNVADMVLMAAVILLGIYSYWTGTRNPAADAPHTDPPPER